jgi:type II secretory pathway component PulK
MINAQKRARKKLWWLPVRREREGSILILVVWVLTLLSLLSVGFGARVSFALGLTDRFQNEFGAQYAARGGIQYAISVLQEDEFVQFDGFKEDWYRRQELFKHQQLAFGQFSIWSEQINMETEELTKRYGLTDEESKINLNTAPVEVLRNLFMFTGGLEDVMAETMAHEIVDWRDEDEDALPYGAEDSDYKNGRHRYESKDAPFQAVEELRLVRSATPEIFTKVRPYLTVFGSGGVNVNTASKEVLVALGLSEFGADSIVDKRSGADTFEGTLDDQLFISSVVFIEELRGVVDDKELVSISDMVKSGLLAVRSDTFHFFVTGKTTREKWDAQLECVVSRSGSILALTEGAQ